MNIKMLLKRLIQFSIGSIGVLILGFISQPIITRIISPIEMGKYSIFNTVLNLIMVFVIMGFDQAYGRFFYEEEEKSGLFLQCIKYPLLSSVITSIIVFIFYRPITEYLVGQASIICAIMISIFLISNVIYTFQILYVRMGQKAKKFSVYTILLKISYLILVLLLFQGLNDSYMTLVAATVISYVIVVVIAYIADRNFYQSLIGKKDTKISINKILKYSLPLILSTALNWVFQSIDKIMIKMFAGYGEIGIYTGALSIVNMLNAVQSMFTTFWVPTAFEHYKNEPNDTMFYSKINEILSFVMLLGAALLISCKDVLGVLLGDEYYAATRVFPFLVFMPIMYTISETTVMGINFKEKTNKHINITLFSAVFNCVGNYILVPMLGAKGAAISSGLSYVVLFVLRTYYSNKYYKVQYKLKKFAFACVLIYCLAICHSFWSMNLYLLIFSIAVIGFECVLYGNIIKEMLVELKATRIK